MNDSTGAPVLALVTDLIFASKIRGAGGAAGVATRTVRTPDAVWAACGEATPRMILLDLEARSGEVPALIRRLKAAPATRAVPVIGFASHVNREAMRAARDAGADRVLARSAFVRELPALLRVREDADG